MKALATLDVEQAGALKGVLFDLDDTLLTDGALTRAAYSALCDLADAGLTLVAVTGRPSGWAEVFVRHWPIDGAVTENGAVLVVRDGAGVQVHAPAGLLARRAELDALAAAFAQTFPEVALTRDDWQRRADRAWDIGEAVRVPPARVDVLADWLRARGARTVRSTVHLHASLEVDDKATGAVRYLRERFAEGAAEALGRWAFIGDSPNDAPCFSAFRYTFGVANVRRYLGRLSLPPRWVTCGEQGAGFAEFARTLLQRRAPLDPDRLRR